MSTMTILNHPADTSITNGLKIVSYGVNSRTIRDAPQISKPQFHRPHPEKEVKPYQIKDARLFLENAGVKP
jgi:hypothetical protein